MEFPFPPGTVRPGTGQQAGAHRSGQSLLPAPSTLPARPAPIAGLADKRNSTAEKTTEIPQRQPPDANALALAGWLADGSAEIEFPALDKRTFR